MGTRRPPSTPGEPGQTSLLDRRNFTGRKSASLQGLGPRGPRGLGHALIAARLIDEDDEPTPYLTELLGELVGLLSDEATLPRPNAINALRPLALEAHIRNALEIFQRRYHLCPTGRFDRPTLMELARQNLVAEPRFIKRPAGLPPISGAAMRIPSTPPGAPGPASGPSSSSPTGKAPSAAPPTATARPTGGTVKRGLS